MTSAGRVPLNVGTNSSLSYWERSEMRGLRAARADGRSGILGSPSTEPRLLRGLRSLNTSSWLELLSAASSYAGARAGTPECGADGLEEARDSRREVSAR